MLPFKANMKLCIFQYFCCILLHMIYSYFKYDKSTTILIACGFLPVLITWLIMLISKSENVTIRCLYVAVLFSGYFIGYRLETMAMLIFIYLATGLLISMFIKPRILLEYMIISTGILFLVVILNEDIVNKMFKTELYLIYLTIYCLGNMSQIFLVLGANAYKKSMEEKTEEVKLAAESKSNFLANMSHEIRTPMNAISGISDLLLNEGNCPEKEMMYLRTIKSSSDNLLGIINDILDSTKIDSGKLEIVSEEYRLDELVEEVINIILFRIGEKDIKIQTNVDSDIPKILIGDAMRIRQVLINLLTNAVKFTEKGNVTLTLSWESVSTTKGKLFASVIDTGIGIKEEDIDSLFTAFSQVDTKKNRNVEGSGLGLALCKKLLLLMDGNIELQSKYGKGSIFSIYIPQGVLENAATENLIIQKSPKIRTIYEIEFMAPEAKVLIVDDNKVNIKVAAALMKKFGFDAMVVDSGQGAIDIIEQGIVFDIIFMDHMMPGMDGIEATTLIRNLEKQKKSSMTIIALTANAINGVEQQFIDAGMNDYLAKPILLRSLGEMLKKWIPEEKQKKI